MRSSEARARTRATYADVEALPEHVVGEILDRELYTSPSPRLPHALAETRLASELGPPFDRGRKLGLYARERVPHLWLVSTSGS